MIRMVVFLMNRRLIRTGKVRGNTAYDYRRRVFDFRIGVSAGAGFKPAPFLCSITLLSGSPLPSG
jgi:hypothetical protein